MPNTTKVYRERRIQQRIQSVKLELSDWVLVADALVQSHEDELAEQIACTVGLEKVIGAMPANARLIAAADLLEAAQTLLMHFVSMTCYGHDPRDRDLVDHVRAAIRKTTGEGKE